MLYFSLSETAKNNDSDRICSQLRNSNKVLTNAAPTDTHAEPGSFPNHIRHSCAWSSYEGESNENLKRAIKDMHKYLRVFIRLTLVYSNTEAIGHSACCHSFFRACSQYTEFIKLNRLYTTHK